MAVARAVVTVVVTVAQEEEATAETGEPQSER